MDRAVFWKLIDQSRAASSGSVENQEEILQELLQQLPPEEIVSFDYHFKELDRQLTRADLRAATWLCLFYRTVEYFTQFTAWVVAQGRQVHATLSEDPAQLPQVLENNFTEDPECFPYAEEMSYVATAAYQACTGGKELPSMPLDGPYLWVSDFDDEQASLVMPEMWQRQAGQHIEGLDFTLREWDDCHDLVALLTFINRHGRTPCRFFSFERKLRWFACSCCWRIRHLLSGASSLDAAVVAEHYAAGSVSPPELYRAYEAQGRAQFPPRESKTAGVEEATLTALFTASPHYSDATRAAVHSMRALAADSPNPETIRKQETAFQIEALRDLFGDLFYSGGLQPHWVLANDRAVRRVAEAIDEERAFERLPVLADTLEEAGCSEPTILDHCRGGGMHVRGCWVIDLLLRSPGMVPEVSAWPFGDGANPPCS
jgi:hypothetical protein